MQAILAEHNHRKRHALVVIEGHFPAITVAEVLENGALQVKLILMGGLLNVFKVGMDILFNNRIIGRSHSEGCSHNQ